MKNELSGYNKNRKDLFDEAFDSFFRPTFFNLDDAAMKTDIREDKNGYTLEIEMPGYDKDDINISLEDGYVTVSGKKHEEKNDNSVYLRRERSVSCSRSYYIGDVAEEDVKAKFEDGVLTVLLPKEKEKAVTSHNIKID